MVEDVDGNVFLDMSAGIAVTANGHAHPQVVRAIQEQSTRLLHMSGTDFYFKTSSYGNDRRLYLCKNQKNWVNLFLINGSPGERQKEVKEILNPNGIIIS